VSRAAPLVYVFLQELSKSMGIPIDQLIFTVMDGPNEGRGHQSTLGYSRHSFIDIVFSFI
jgi:hypothetical protein